MTAINNDGQLYWTFEELDFEGAAKLVLQQMNESLAISETLLAISSSLEKNDVKRKGLGFAVDYIHSRTDKLYAVLQYLKLLRDGEKFNG